MSRFLRQHPDDPGTRAAGLEGGRTTMSEARCPRTSGRGAPPYRSGAGAGRPKRIRIHHLRELKERGERWAMLTAYDTYTAEIFDEAGIPVLLVGDSAANNVYGYENTLPVTVDELLPLVKAVVRGARVRAGRGRPAVRQLPDRARAGPHHRVPVHEGGRRARRQAGGRGAVRAAGRGARRGRHPGDGAPRLHPAERARARRLPRAGPRRRPATGSSRTRSPCRPPARSRWCWRWCPPTSPSASPPS